jgi:hypothetical protein
VEEPLNQLLNLYGVNVVRQTEIHTAKPLVHQPSACEVEIVTEKLKRPRSPGIVQIPAELIKDNSLRYISLLIMSEIRRNCLSSGKSQSLNLFLRSVITLAVVTPEAHHFCQLCTKLA